MAVLAMAGALALPARTSEAITWSDSKPGLEFVGVDFDVRTPDHDQIDDQLDKAKEIGYNALRMITTWSVDQAEAYNDVPYLEYAVEAARERGIEPMLSVTPCWQSENCLAPTSQNQKRFVTTLSHLGQALDVKYWIIGNEPNSSRFWNFQFAQNGESRAPESYYNLVAKSYDELKKLSPDNVVICGALASSGDDDPSKNYPSHSVYRFIEGMANAYKKSGRQLPFCDVLAMHPHLKIPTESPLIEHGEKTVGFADYPKLIKAWDRAFKDTPQPRVPIYYTEFGIDSEIPKSRSAFYSGSQGERVSEKTRAEYLVRAYQTAACQARVIGLNNFLLYDEPRLSGWQSGSHYSDGTPKSSYEPQRQAIEEAKSGSKSC